MKGGVNAFGTHPKTGKRPKAPKRAWVDEADYPLRIDRFDYLGRPLEQTLTDEEVAAFGGPKVRTLSYPSYEEEMASLDKQAAELEEKLKAAAEATNALMLQMIEDRASLGQVVGAKVTAAEGKAAVEARAAQKAAKKGGRRSMAFTPSKSSSGGGGEVDGGVLAGVAAAIAAAGYYFSTTGGSSVPPPPA